MAQLLCTVQLNDCLWAAGTMKKMGIRVLAVRVNSYCILPNHFKAQMQHTTLRCALITNHYKMCQIKSASTEKCDHICARSLLLKCWCCSLMMLDQEHLFWNFLFSIFLPHQRLYETVGTVRNEFLLSSGIKYSFIMTTANNLHHTFPPSCLLI